MQELRDARYAFTMLAFSQFIPDRIGRLWVREAHYQDAISAGSLTMPKNFQPDDIGADYVLGKQYIDGVSKVLQFALTQDIKR